MFSCAKDQSVATVNGVKLSAADFDKNLERKSGKLEENLGGKSGEEDVKKRLKGINF